MRVARGPGRAAERFAAWIVGRDRAESVIGDLVEEYEGVCSRRGQWVAGVWFLLQTLFVGTRLRLGEWRGPGWGADVRVGVRRLMREPGFSVVAVLALALAIAANGVVLSVARTVLFGPMPFPAWDRLGVLTSDHVGSETGGFGVSLLSMSDLSERTRTIEASSLYMDWQDLTLTTRDEAHRVPAAFVDAAYFDLLGLDVSLGRAITPEENQPTGAQPVAVLGHGFWRSAFGGDPNVVGRSLLLNGRSWQIIGVLADDRGDLRYRWGEDPVGIFLPLRAADALTPFQLDTSRGLRVLNALVRLNPSATIPTMQEELTRISESLAQIYPADHEGWTFRIEALDEAFYASFRAPTRVLIGGSIVVLLLVIVNLTTLVLIRATGRSDEWRVRRTLGASRGVLFRQLVTEHSILTLAGGTAGILLALWLLSLIESSAALNLPSYASTRLEGRTVVASLSVALVLGAWFSAMTMLALRGQSSGAGLSGTRQSASRTVRRAQAGLVAAEVALALALLVGAGLLLQSLRTLEGTGYGFDAERLLLARVDLRGERFSDDVLRAQSSQLIERAERIAGVEAAFVWSPNRLGHGNDVELLTLEGRFRDNPHERLEASMHLLHPGTLAKLGVPLLSGRDVAASDGAGAPRVALISQDLATALWPGQDPIGQRMETVERGSPLFITVIGVVGNARHRTRLIQPFGPQRDIYYPYAQNPLRTWTLALRYADGADVAAITRAARGVIRDIDPQLPVHEVTTMAERMREEESRSRLATTLVATYALLALALATLGLYGVISYWVAQRRREIGIRLAVGAGRGAILRTILHGGVSAVGFGIVAGVVLAVASAGAIEAALYGTRPLQAPVFAVAAVTLALVALAACVVPAWRASRLEPSVVLRDGSL